MTSKSTVQLSIEETLKKVTSSLLPSIEDHVASTEFDSTKDGLDFLEVSFVMNSIAIVNVQKVESNAIPSCGSLVCPFFFIPCLDRKQLLTKRLSKKYTHTHF